MTQQSRRSRSRIEVGDCIEVMRAMPMHSVDAVVTDPPYGLGFMGKEWDRPDFMAADMPMRRSAAQDAVNAGTSRQGGRQRAGEDFLKRQARDARAFEEWCRAWAAEALRVLKPGGHLLAFGGTRMAHRLASGIEDAGFEVRDTIAWMYGSGFPKSLNVGEGRGTALKPAHEPIIMGRKALGGTVAATVMEHGTGALNIDACRIGARKERVLSRNGLIGYGGSEAQGEVIDGGTGRWPANVVLDPEAAAQLDQQTGECRSAGEYVKGNGKQGDKAGPASIPIDGLTSATYSDEGGASRFFYVAKADDTERNAGLGEVVSLFAPADAPGRNDHPTVKPIDLMRWLCRLVTPPGGTVLDPFTGSGTTGCAATLEGFSFIGIEREAAYASIARARLAHWSLEAA